MFHYATVLGGVLCDASKMAALETTQTPVACIADIVLEQANTYSCVEFESAGRLGRLTSLISTIAPAVFRQWQNLQ